MNDYYEDGYEIEPFMPGISPVGKGTPGIAEVSVPRPYIPYGTGYNAVRPRPGYSQLKGDLSGMGRIELHADRQIRPNGEFGRIVKEPQNYLDVNPGKHQENAIKQANHQIRLNHHPASGYDHRGINDMRGHTAALREDAPNRNVANYGWERGSYMPKEDMIAYEAGNNPAKRHQIMRALQAREPWGLGRTAEYPENLSPGRDSLKPRDVMTGNLDGEAAYQKDLKNLEAKIGANKSIRKGVEQFVNKPANEAERLRDFNGRRTTSRSLKEGAAKVVRAIPGKPGMFTGRVPSMQGLGGGLVDMFMEGPELQKAKTDPLYGMGKEERARIEAAYQYGL